MPNIQAVDVKSLFGKSTLIGNYTASELAKYFSLLENYAGYNSVTFSFPCDYEMGMRKMQRLIEEIYKSKNERMPFTLSMQGSSLTLSYNQYKHVHQMFQIRRQTADDLSSFVLAEAGPRQLGQQGYEVANNNCVNVVVTLNDKVETVKALMEPANQAEMQQEILELKQTVAHQGQQIAELIRAVNALTTKKPAATSAATMTASIFSLRK